MEKLDKSIFALVCITFILSVCIVLIGVNEEKRASPCPSQEIIISTENVDSKFMQLKRETEKSFALQGICQFSVSQNEKQIAIIPYLERKICVFDLEGNYQYSVYFKSNSESFSIYYHEDNLRLIIGGDTQVIAEFDDKGNLNWAKRLDRKYSSIHNDWVRYYTYKKEQKIGENRYQKKSGSVVQSILGINTFIEKKEEGLSRLVIETKKQQVGIVLFTETGKLLLYVLLIWGILFVLVVGVIKPVVLIDFLKNNIKFR